MELIIDLLGHLGIFAFIITMLTIPFLIFITGRYMDSQLGHMANDDKVRKFFIFAPRLIAYTIIYSIGIVFNRFGKKSTAYQTYGDLKMRDYARPIDKFLSFTFYGSWGVVLIISLVWYILRWFVEGNIVFIEYFNFLTEW